VFLKLAELYADETGRVVMNYLIEHGEATDEEISEDLEMPVGDVRRILYKLNDKSVVLSRMERDPNTGWITYYWYVPKEQLDGILYSLKKDIKERLEKRLEYESENVFYWCGHEEEHCKKVPFSVAVDNLFKCPNCGSSLKPYDNSQLIVALNWAVKTLEKELKSHLER
jgi:transcription initiation factor TFIIE subunit alpha